MPTEWRNCLLAVAGAHVDRLRNRASTEVPIRNAAGKGTLIDKLMADGTGKFGFSCSHTTRQPRPGEVVSPRKDAYPQFLVPQHASVAAAPTATTVQDGQHYHFTTREAFEAAIGEGKFLEYAYVHNNIYGTSVKASRHSQQLGRQLGGAGAGRCSCCRSPPSRGPSCTTCRLCVM